MLPNDDEERETTDQTETETGDETEVSDPRDSRIAELEAALAEANARVEAVSQGLFATRVGALDLLADPSVMPYSPDLLDANDDALKAAVLALIASQPDLGKLRVTGDIDQGAREEVAAPPGLIETLKQFI